MSFIGTLMDEVSLRLDDHSADIKLGFGIALAIISLKSVIEATQKHNDEIVAAKEDLIDITESKKESDKLPEDDPNHYDEEEYVKDKKEAYKKLVSVHVKTYAPGVTAMALAVAFITWSHADMVQRNLVLNSYIGAQTSMLNNIFKEIEKRHGKEEADEIRNGVIKKKEVVENPDGTKETVEKTEFTGPRLYRYKYDKTASTFKTNKFQRAAYISLVEQSWNDALMKTRYTHRHKGYVYVNEVLNDFGIPLDRMAQNMGYGWLYDPNDTTGSIHNYISIHEDVVTEVDPVSGLEEENVYLTFNCDGPITDRLFRRNGMVLDTLW